MNVYDEKSKQQHALKYNILLCMMQNFFIVYNCKQFCKLHIIVSIPLSRMLSGNSLLPEQNLCVIASRIVLHPSNGLMEDADVLRYVREGKKNNFDSEETNSCRVERMGLLSIINEKFVYPRLKAI